MRNKLALSLAFFFCMAASLPFQAVKSEAALKSSEVRDRSRIRSLKQIRLEKTVRQKWDLSCGSAALSTILTHHFHDKTSEAVIITSILRITDPVKIRNRGGFSLLDLKRFLAARGYVGNGYAEMTVTELVEMKTPAIVPIRARGYDHFVVFRGVLGDRAILSDPAFGTVTMRLDLFAEVWKGGIAFIVSRPGFDTSRGGLIPENEAPVTPDGTVIRRTLFMSSSPLTRR